MIDIPVAIDDLLEGLWNHQETEVRDHWFDPARALLWEPRAGKTLATTRNMRALMRAGVNSFLIVTLKMAAQDVWLPALEDDVKRHALICDLSRGTALERAAKFEDYQIQATRLQIPLVVVINYDMLWPLRDMLYRWAPKFIAVDESHLIKTPGANRSRVLEHLAPKAKYRRILTGTPDPNSYLDYYSQYKFLDRRIFGSRAQAFRARYAICHPIFKSQVLEWINMPEFEEKLYSVASRVLSKDCFDVPEEHDVIRRLELPKAARALYDGIVADDSTMLDDAGVYGTSQNKLVRLLRFRQLTSGFLPSNRNDDIADDEVRWVHEVKLDALEDEVTTLNGKKVVIFYQYRPEGDAIMKRLGKIAVRIDGRVKDDVRVHALNAFRAGDLQCLVLQERVGKLAISLKVADYAIFFSLGPEWESHFQARRRIWKEDDKVGEGIKLTYIYLLMKDSVDNFLMQTMNRKSTAHHQLLDVGFRKAALGEA